MGRALSRCGIRLLNRRGLQVVACGTFGFFGRGGLFIGEPGGVLGFIEFTVFIEVVFFKHLGRDRLFRFGFLSRRGRNRVSKEGECAERGGRDEFFHG